MKNNIAHTVVSVAGEYGFKWLFNRMLYSIRLKMMQYLPCTEKIFEKRVDYPVRCNIFDINTGELEQFLNRLSDKEKDRIIKEADNACRGKIKGFSGTELDYGWPVSWQMNPVTGRSCESKMKWYRIPDFDAGRGDIKLIWEISRFSVFITFARAYLITKDLKYYRAYAGQLHDWIQKNPYPFGAGYKCGQECSFRMANTLLAYAVFDQCGLVDGAVQNDVKRLVYRSYKKVRSNFFYAYKCIRNDHTFSELMGMILGAWCAEDEKTLDYAYKILEEEIMSQFSEDGGYRMFSFNYEREVFQDIECILAAGRSVKRVLSGQSADRLAKAVDVLYQCQDGASGYLPNYGSNDGTLVFPVTSCGFRDYRPVLNTVSVMATGKRLYGNGIYDEEILWFLGRKDFEKKEAAKKSRRYDKAGIYTLRRGGIFVFLVANDYHTRPDHMDQLHMDLWLDGRNVFCDSGTYSYVEKEGRELALSDAHNTVTVKGKNQMNRYGHFMVYDWTVRKNLEWKPDCFTALVRSRNGYRHRRKVSFKNSMIVIYDEIYGKKGDVFSVKFHTVYPVRIREGKNKVAEICDSSSNSVLCVLEGTKEWKIEECMVSETYLSKRNAKCLSVNGIIKNKAEIVETRITTGETADNG